MKRPHWRKMTWVLTLWCALAIPAGAVARHKPKTLTVKAAVNAIVDEVYGAYGALVGQGLVSPNRCTRVSATAVHCTYTVLLSTGASGGGFDQGFNQGMAGNNLSDTIRSTMYTGQGTARLTRSGTVVATVSKPVRAHP